MLTKRDASDRHFSIAEKIEKVRPKRNGAGDIDKCITYCEEGMDNLPAFIKEDYGNALADYRRLKRLGIERKFVAPIPPPSIPCRDVLINCYLMTDQFDSAKSVVNRTLVAKAWDKEEYDKQITFIKNVQSARDLLFKRLTEHPGTLQKDVYAILPDVDKKAMQWYLANSKSIYKVKLKSTYSLWLDEKDIPDKVFKESEEIATANKEAKEKNANQAKEVMLRNDLSVQFPEWYVSISFGKSSSQNYNKAVLLAKKSPQYIKTVDDDNNIIHQAVYSNEADEYLSFISLYELVQAWKSTFVVINGEIVDRKIIGGLNYCYGDKIRSGNPEFCFGASYMTENPFGCHRLQISRFNNPWWTFGKFDNKGIWIIDKDAISRRIKEYSVSYIHCPAFSMAKILERLDELPDFINPKRNRNWISTGNGVEPKNLHEEISLTIQLDSPKIEKKQGILSKLLSLTGFRK